MSVSPAKMVDCRDDAAASEFYGVEQLQCPVEPFERQEVVLTEDIGPLLREYIEKQSQMDTDDFGNAITPNGLTAHCGVITRLAFETGVDERNIFRAMHQEGASVDIGTADALMMAMNRTIHELDIYLAPDVRKAANEQGRLVRTVARARGVYVPTGQALKNEMPRIRRKLLA